MQTAQQVKDLFSSQRLLIGMTGSIAVLSLTSYIIAFGQFFKEVRVIMTSAACQFIPPSALQHICHGVHVDNNGEVGSMGHVKLGCWADLFLVMPATANTLAQAAHGIAQNLLTQTLLSFEGKAIFFPHMNRRMWVKPSVQRNIAQLEMDGHLVCPPIETDIFEVASGSTTKGIAIPHFPEILNFITTHFQIAKRPVLEVI